MRQTLAFTFFFFFLLILLTLRSVVQQSCVRAHTAHGKFTCWFLLVSSSPSSAAGTAVATVDDGSCTHHATIQYALQHCLPCCDTVNWLHVRSAASSSSPFRVLFIFCLVFSSLILRWESCLYGLQQAGRWSVIIWASFKSIYIAFLHIAREHIHLLNEKGNQKRPEKRKREYGGTDKGGS